VPLIRVQYEPLVQCPEVEMRRVFDFLGLSFEAGAIEYGRHAHDTKGLGDPLGVNRHARPVTKSVDTWAVELAQNPAKLRLVREMIATIDDADLETWGFPRATFFDPVEAAAGGAGRQLTRPPLLDGFRLQRKLLKILRRNIQHNAFGRLVRRTRMLCDVLLRG